MQFEGINKSTGEIIKPYETEDHKEVLKVVNRQVKFVRDNIKDESGKELLSSKSGDILVQIMTTLVGFYEELGRWTADERLHVADLKTSNDLKFATQYLSYKEESQTNQTSSLRARKDCEEDQKELDKAKHALDIVEKWRKAVGRYHDSVRSVLSYEKSLAYMSR